MRSDFERRQLIRMRERLTPYHQTSDLAVNTVLKVCVGSHDPSRSDQGSQGTFVGIFRSSVLGSVHRHREQPPSKIGTAQLPGTGP